ncbi:glycosyltransferase family 2 protein [Parvularcula marina]|uniref:glycosyltransferase family 2 protein n=1 Tax=Parvularcula marina TaxID=2292771 RepID=UPI00351698FB
MSNTPASIFAFDRSSDDAIELSVVAPMYNEEGGAEILVREIAEALAGRSFEIIMVDDASTDGTRAVLKSLKDEIPQLRVLCHAKNSGQSRAVRTGILAAKAPIIATLDGDGQNVPGDIPKLFDILTRPDAPQLLAMVGGERQKRQDSAAKKRASKYANQIRKWVLKDEANDTGCGLKVFWRQAFLRLPYFDHLHRYIPALMVREGFMTEFVSVAHRPREHGQSKYTNFGRAAVAVRDLFGVSWLIARSRHPHEIEEL